MSLQMIFILCLLIVMFTVLICEWAQPAILFFSVLVVLMFSGILTIEEALDGFANEGVHTVGLLFIIAGAVQKSGLIDHMIKKWLPNSHSHIGPIVRFYLPVSLFSAFLNNTPIVATFTPVIKTWCENHGIAPSKLLIPLSYVTILGGMMTLMGTSTNLVVHGLMLEYGLSGFSFFTLAVVGIPATLAGFLYLFTIGYRLLPDNKGFSQSDRYEMKKYIAEVLVTYAYPYHGKSIGQAGLRDLKGLYMIKVIRGNEQISPVRSSTIIQRGDRLIFTGLISTLAELQKVKGLKLETGTNITLDELESASAKLVDAVVSEDSALLSKSIKHSQFRSRFDAGIVAVHRHNERIHSKVGDIVLKPGDSLLLLAGPDFAEKVQHVNDFFVVSSLDTPTGLRQNLIKGWLSIMILIVSIVTVALGWLSMFKAMALVVVVFLAGKIITLTEAKEAVHFNVLLLIASSLGIGTAMLKTGLAKWLADALLAVGMPMGLIVILFLIYILTNVFTEIITNSAAAAMMLPIGMEVAQTLAVNPLGIAVLIAIAASASFMTPIGYQTNLIVYGPGGYTFMDYLRVGCPLSMVVMLVSVFTIYYVWF